MTYYINVNFSVSSTSTETGSILLTFETKQEKIGWDSIVETLQRNQAIGTSSERFVKYLSKPGFVVTVNNSDPKGQLYTVGETPLILNVECKPRSWVLSNNAPSALLPAFDINIENANDGFLNCYIKAQFFWGILVAVVAVLVLAAILTTLALASIALAPVVVALQAGAIIAGCIIAFAVAVTALTFIAARCMGVPLCGAPMQELVDASSDTLGTSNETQNPSVRAA